MPEETPPPATRFEVMRGMLPALFVLAILGGGWLAVRQINRGGLSGEEEIVGEQEPLPDTLTLPAGKLSAAKFATIPAEVRPVNHLHTIPGRIRYDETKHVDVKAPMDGILAEVLVTPGEQVTCGQLLAVLRSPEIGQARAEILKRQTQRAIAENVMQRELTLTQNLEQMLTLLDQGRSIDEIETAFGDRPLGSYREDILSAYARMQLSSELLAKMEPLADSGSVSGRAIREHQTERRIAQTAFRTARDQATFEAKQAKMKAEAELAEADRQLNLAWQAVETLLGYKEDKNTVSLDNEEALSRLEIRAPFAGTVESRGFANNERVARGDSLVVLANTESLYVSASVREDDWPAVSLQEGTPVSVSVPALDDRVLEGRIRYFGREVQPDTNSIPLIATIDNREGLLRPGMFVRVTIPIGKSRRALSVKSESVVQHENQSFVFVDMKGGTFKRVDISTGESSEDWVEVTQGLSPGQPIVTDGAFLLKSEFLLQGEGE
jgi:cobalt-zinc-cadmium efflux system membrane fusion protein